MFRFTFGLVVLVLVLVVGCQAETLDSERALELHVVTGEVIDTIEVEVQSPHYDDLRSLSQSVDLPWDERCDADQVASGFDVTAGGVLLASTRVCASPEEGAYRESVRAQFPAAPDDIGESHSALGVSGRGWIDMCAQGSEYHCCLVGGGGWNCLWLL